MSLKYIAAGTALVGAALAAANPSVAQTNESVNGQQLQQQIQQLQQQLNTLQNQVNDSQAQAKKAQEDAAAARAQAQAGYTGGPRITFGENNRPGWVSADGQNSIELTSRVHFDIGDYFHFTPGSYSAKTQDLNSGVNARRARIGILGKFMGDWQYALIYDFGGSTDTFSPQPTNSFGTASGIENAFITYNGLHPVHFDLGYMDTPFTLDEATSSNDIMFMERSSAQVIATQFGAGDFRSAFGTRANGDRWWVGAYLTGPQSGDSHTVGQPVSAFGRATYQVLQTSDYSLHIGADAIGIVTPPRVAAANGQPAFGAISLSDRPELRIDPTQLIGPGSIGSAANPVDGGSVFSGEFAGGYHSLFAQAEYYHYRLKQRDLSTDSFDGGYIQASYTLTGESRKYIPQTGAYSGIVPAHPLALNGSGFGAWEIAARYSIIDFGNSTFTTTSTSDGSVSTVTGGRQQVYTLGVNWYPVRNIRFMLNYLHGDVDKPNTVGVNLGARFDAIAMRTQIAF